MVFSSILFLTVFLPLFLLGYFILPRRIAVKHFYFQAASFIFYAWGAPKFVFIIFFTTIIDFYLVKKMDSYEDGRKRKLFLLFPVLMNVGLLCYFKYANFFMDNVDWLFGLVHINIAPMARILLPIGISFFTFESITYSVDVYRRVHAPLNKFWEYQMYIIFFPKLIAGPIVRYHEIADQLQSHIKFDNFDNRIKGFIRFCIGLSKKVLIANVAAQQADAVFATESSHLTTTIAWVGALAYTIQIYFDFSGYSDMAIGISKMLGFTLPENFNSPYTSKSITEFWRRWHITLGNWMKNYLYIPLGGNRASKGRVLMNLFIVFLLSGLWHGAGWNFVLWGAYYGVFLVLERLTIRKKAPSGMVSYLGWIYTFVVVVVGWVFFRQRNVHAALLFTGKMFSFDFSHRYVFVYNAEFFFILIVALLFSFCTLNGTINKYQERIFGGMLGKKEMLLYGILGMAAYYICLISLSNGQFNPFIYFKF